MKTLSEKFTAKLSIPIIEEGQALFSQGKVIPELTSNESFTGYVSDLFEVSLCLIDRKLMGKCSCRKSMHPPHRPTLFR